MFKYQLLQDFIHKHKNLPQQGSDEWKRQRKDFIGGSEVATILKQNKNKSVTKLILEKLGFDPFNGSAVTYWGNVFEEVIRQHCEEVFKCAIRETGSIPYEHGKLSYSPDGLAVVPTQQLITRLGALTSSVDSKCPTQLVLFEFKCPHSRVATDEIPEYYLPQVSIGMNIIDIMETAVFIQATFRRCSFSQLAYNKHHNPYGHYKRADISGNPVECGFMIIWAPQIENSYFEGLRESMLSSGGSLISDVVDIGNITETTIIEEILGKCVDKSFSIDYTIREMYDQSVFDREKYVINMYNTSLQFQLKKKLRQRLPQLSNVIGILPFKLLNVHMTPVAKNAQYIEQTDAYIKATNVLQCINDHQGMDNKADVMKSVRKYKI